MEVDVHEFIENDDVKAKSYIFGDYFHAEIYENHSERNLLRMYFGNHYMITNRWGAAKWFELNGDGTINIKELFQKSIPMKWGQVRSSILAFLDWNYGIDYKTLEKKLKGKDVASIIEEIVNMMEERWKIKSTMNLSFV